MKRKFGVYLLILNVKIRRLSNFLVENLFYKNDDDEDVIILEENSIFKFVVDFEVKLDIEVKLEQSYIEQSGIYVDFVSSFKFCVQVSFISIFIFRSDLGITVFIQIDVLGLIVKKEESMEEDMGVRNGIVILFCVSIEVKVQEISVESVDVISYQL